MAFCANCGQQLSNGAKFCSQCGSPVDMSPSSKTIIDSEIHKCSSCGAILNSFCVECPACGRELRGIQNSSLVRELALKLENEENYQQRLVVIRNFPIPNTKEDIFEFMMMASSNFDASMYASHLDEEDESDAWLSKIEQCYKKAKMVFNHHSDFQKIEEMYNKVKSECKGQEEKYKSDLKEYILNKKREESSESFKNGSFRYVLFICAIISALMTLLAFSYSRLLSGVIAVVVCALTVIAILMGYNVIKEKIINIRIAVFILALLLIIPYFLLYHVDWSFRDLNPNVIKMEIDSDHLINNSSTAIQSLLESKGFTNINLEEVPWNKYYTPGVVLSISIDEETKFTASSRFEKDSLVVISYVGNPLMISVGYDYLELIGLPYFEVAEKIEESGFGNIEYKSEPWNPDIESQTVVGITINGESNFTANSTYLQDAKIIIKYIQSPKNIYLSCGVEDLLGMQSERVKDIFIDMGFVYVELVGDGWNLFHKSGAVKSIQINGSNSFNNGDCFTQDVKIVIYYYE